MQVQTHRVQMEDKQLQILDDLENAIDKFISDFEKQLPGANQEIYDELNTFLGQLKKTSSGNIQTSVENLKLIDKYRTTFDKALSQGQYSDSAREFISKFHATTGYIDDYFGSIVASFANNDGLYKAILQSNIDSTTETLLGSGVDANFKEPIIKILKDNVISGSDIKSARQVLKDFVIGNKDIDPKLSRYTSQVANDTLRQFNRNYTKAISDDLGLEYGYYKGTKIKDSRPFCEARAGKYFTKKEIQDWAALNWAGKMAGTNKDTIFIYCGGYNCQHDIIPVSKKLYDLFASK